MQGWPIVEPEVVDSGAVAECATAGHESAAQAITIGIVTALRSELIP